MLHSPPSGVRSHLRSIICSWLTCPSPGDSLIPGGPTSPSSAATSRGQSTRRSCARASPSSQKRVLVALQFVNSSFWSHYQKLTLPQSCVTLSEGHVPVVHSMLAFIYLGDYDDTAFNHIDYEACRLNLLVLEIADQYKLPDLWRLARKKFTRAASGGYFGLQFVEAIEMIWTVPTRYEQCIRDNVLNICVAHATDLFGDQETRQARWEADGQDRHIYITVPSPASFLGVHRDMPQFAVDLATHMARKLQLAADRRTRRVQERNDLRPKNL